MPFLSLSRSTSSQTFSLLPTAFFSLMHKAYSLDGAPPAQSIAVAISKFTDIMPSRRAPQDSIGRGQ